MSDVRATVRRFSEEAHGKGRVELIDELCTEDYVNHTAPEELPPGREGEKAFVRMMLDAFDYDSETERIVVDGDMAAWRWTSRGTHTGEFMGVPASGNDFEVSGINLVLLRDGRIAEAWFEFDMLDVLTQIGAVEQPAG